MDTAGEGEGGMNWESSMEAYTLPYVKQVANGKLLTTEGAQPGALWQPGGVGWDRGLGGGSRGGGIGILLADSDCCLEEANTIL